MNGVNQTPNVTRNTLFDFPTLGAIPSLINTAGAPVTGGLAGAPRIGNGETIAGPLNGPPAIVNEPVMGYQYNGSNYTTSFPPPSFYTPPPNE